jgi:hypothetical protein
MQSAKKARSFGPEALQAMSNAFESACQLLPEPPSEQVRRRLAATIFERVSHGEHDPVRLKEIALCELAEQAPWR